MAVIQGNLPLAGLSAQGAALNANPANAGAAYQQAYNSALAVNTASYNNILKGYNQAIAETTTANDAIAKGYDDLATQVVQGLQGADATAKQEVEEGAAKQQGQADQSLISRGLGNTTVKDAVKRGIEADKNKAKLAVTNSFQKMLADYTAQLKSQGLNFRTASNAQKAALQKQMLDWMNSITAPYPNSQHYADLARQAGKAIQGMRNAGMFGGNPMPPQGGGRMGGGRMGGGMMPQRRMQPGQQPQGRLGEAMPVQEFNAFGGGNAGGFGGEAAAGVAPMAGAGGFGGFGGYAGWPGASPTSADAPTVPLTSTDGEIPPYNGSGGYGDTTPPPMGTPPATTWPSEFDFGGGYGSSGGPAEDWSTGWPKSSPFAAPRADYVAPSEWKGSGGYGDGGYLGEMRGGDGGFSMPNPYSGGGGSIGNWWDNFDWNFDEQANAGPSGDPGFTFPQSGSGYNGDDWLNQYASGNSSMGAGETNFDCPGC